MDPATLLVALERLFSVGGIPMAILGLVAWSWLQDRRKMPVRTEDDFKTDIIRRLARIEAKLSILWHKSGGHDDE